MIVRSERVTFEDDGRYAVLTLAAVAASVSFGAIFAQLGTLKGLPYELKSLQIALAFATIVGSWLFVHLSFALHYAHEFFHTAKADETGVWRGGIAFPDCDRPDYPDFLYFSYVIGVACATADVNITGRQLRRLAILHCILAFFYNNAVLAMSINIGAGFIGG